MLGKAAGRVFGIQECEVELAGVARPLQQQLVDAVGEGVQLAVGRAGLTAEEKLADGRRIRHNGQVLAAGRLFQKLGHLGQHRLVAFVQLAGCVADGGDGQPDLLVNQVVGMGQGLGLAGHLLHLGQGLVGIARGLVRRFPALKGREQAQEGRHAANHAVMRVKGMVDEKRRGDEGNKQQQVEQAAAVGVEKKTAKHDRYTRSEDRCRQLASR